MSETATLTPAQSKVVYNLHKAIENIGETNPYAPEDFRAASNAIGERFRELEAAFPEVAKRATEYYEAELPDILEDTEGYEDALFSLLLELRSFTEANTLSRVSNCLSGLNNHVYDLATFSDEYNAERGFWNADLT